MVQVIPVSPKNWEVPKIQLKEGVTKSKFDIPEPRLEGENLSKNITYFARVTVSTVKENVKDTEKDTVLIIIIIFLLSLPLAWKDKRPWEKDWTVNLTCSW